MHHFPYLSSGLPHRREPGEPPSPLCRTPARVLELQVCSRRKDCSNAVPPARPALPSTPTLRAVFLQDSVIFSKAQALTNLLLSALRFTLMRKKNTLVHQAEFLFAIGGDARILYTLRTMQKCLHTHRHAQSFTNTPTSRAVPEYDGKLIIYVHELTFIHRNTHTSARFILKSNS